MDILQTFYDYFANNSIADHNFSVFKYTEMLFIGKDSNGYPVVVCKSNKPNRAPLRQKTKKLSVECNVHVRYVCDGKEYNEVAHIIRCFSTTKKERDIFLELCSFFEEASLQDDQEESILEIVSILSSLFADTVELSDIELQGLYAELYTMWFYRAAINMAALWQSRQRMTFDFSVSDNIKIEVKSTIKNERKHHFRHEQLMEDPYIVYVISYMMRHDDEGLSLLELINLVKPMLKHDPRKLLAIDRVVKNTSEDRLKNFKFNEDFLQKRKKIFRAADIPKFTENTPDGVSNTEYDCNLENINDLPEDIFETEINEILKGGVDYDCIR